MELLIGGAQLSVGGRREETRAAGCWAVKLGRCGKGGKCWAAQREERHVARVGQHEEVGQRAKFEEEKFDFGLVSIMACFA